MIIVKLKGGLGNQLFQYSFGRLLSRKRQEDFKLDIREIAGRRDTYRCYRLDNFRIRAEIASSEEILTASEPYGLVSRLSQLFFQKILRRFNIGYNGKLLLSRAQYFEGFFQSYRYLDPIRSELLSEISLKEDICGKYNKVISQIKSDNSVAVHIRRGDYVNNAKTKKDHFVCDLNYYERAIDLMQSKLPGLKLFVFSDDISWAKANIKAEKTVFVSQPGMEDYEELILMSLCRHAIIANSSFSFWAAWLNQNDDKIIIAPKVWNRRYDKQYLSLLPKNWIRI